MLLLCSCSEEPPTVINPYITPRATVIAMGASLMSPDNSWFGDGCLMAKCNSINRAVGGLVPVDFAEKLWKHSFCTLEEFEKVDILAIQLANAGNVYECDSLKDCVSDYTKNFIFNTPTNPFKKYNNAQLLDYILKMWKEMCERQQYNYKSKWFNHPNGKPFKVILVTHWHDARTDYNQSVRLLAKKWNIPVCEFDTKIGFSKDNPLPDGTQVSATYAIDFEKINGVVYGWHPKKDHEIQDRMAAIFAETLTNSGYLSF